MADAASLASTVQIIGLDRVALAGVGRTVVTDGWNLRSSRAEPPNGLGPAVVIDAVVAVAVGQRARAEPRHPLDLLMAILGSLVDSGRLTDRLLDGLGAVLAGARTWSIEGPDPEFLADMLTAARWDPVHHAARAGTVATDRGRRWLRLGGGWAVHDFASSRVDIVALEAACPAPHDVRGVRLNVDDRWSSGVLPSVVSSTLADVRGPAALVGGAMADADYWGTTGPGARLGLLVPDEVLDEARAAARGRIAVNSPHDWLGRSRETAVLATGLWEGRRVIGDAVVAVPAAPWAAVDAALNPAGDDRTAHRALVVHLPVSEAAADELDAALDAVGAAGSFYEALAAAAAHVGDLPAVWHARTYGRLGRQRDA